MDQQPVVKQTSAHVHKLVASVAVNCAAELYEVMMGDNVYYEAWKKKFPGMSSKELARRFIEMNWGKCIPVARATLARLLANPTISDSHKEEIMEALVLDSSLIRGRENPVKVIGTATTGEN